MHQEDQKKHRKKWQVVWLLFELAEIFENYMSGIFVRDDAIYQKKIG